jgi:uroporphyrin-III C-methyltransferase / precorrin-2 dehydrogenase / sirohydrochlorin ferrochelatase
MTLHSLPVFLRLAGRPVILIGEGETTDAKRRLLERAGAVVVGEDGEAQVALVALAAPEATVARLRARGVLVNAADRPDLCDFTLPAIVDRSPVIVAIGTGGASAGLAAAVRQRLETMLPVTLGPLATALHGVREQLRRRWPDAAERRRALGRAFAAGGPLDPLRDAPLPEGAALVEALSSSAGANGTIAITLASADPDDLTLRQARALAQADRVVHAADVPPAILDRARADAARIVLPAPNIDAMAGLTVFLEMAR